MFLTSCSVDDDDDEIEVDIMESGRHKKVDFEAQYNWVSTEYDITMDETMGLLRLEVLPKLAAMAKMFFTFVQGIIVMDWNMFYMN